MELTKRTVTFTIQLKFGELTLKLDCCATWDKDAEVFVSYCPTFDVYSQGETVDDAFLAIENAVKMHLTWLMHKESQKKKLGFGLSALYEAC